MEQLKYKLRLGALLHDIAKVLFDDCKPSELMSRLSTEALFMEKLDAEVLDCIRYQTYDQLMGADLDGQALPYITYIANRLVMGINLREEAGCDFDEVYDKQAVLHSVFNILNGNHERKFYKRKALTDLTEINFPCDEEPGDVDGFYKDLNRELLKEIADFELSERYVNSLSSALKNYLSYIPATTKKNQLNDISFYDHIKMRTALADCILEYMRAHEITDYRKSLMEDMADFYKEKAFLLYSVDVSGIQNFIYTISSKGALKGLRSRSFYLDIMMEHIVDEFLEAFHLTRNNLIYCGGGHSYLLLPNTDEIKSQILALEKELNSWFIENFGISLYIAGAYSPCSANELQNIPNGSYSNIFKEISKGISHKKAHRYTADEIRRLNTPPQNAGRECIICRRLDKLDKEDRCGICSKLLELSGEILGNKYFLVYPEEKGDGLKLPFGKILLSCKEEELSRDEGLRTYLRIYQKNSFQNKIGAINVLIGDYRPLDRERYHGQTPTMEDLAAASEGIKRIGILRADVDNLGSAFVSGFDAGQNHATLARTSTLSNQLSLFFKYHINGLLKNTGGHISKEEWERNALIVYSGGDDMFMVGAWNELIDSALDIRNAFESFSQSTLTISAGLGLYGSSYPINIMAKEAALLEDLSKNYVDSKGRTKNALTLFESENTYTWKVLIEEVLGDKFKSIRAFFDQSEGRGKNFLYRLLELMRNTQEKINIARFVYLLSRMEPKKSKDGKGNEAYEAYKEFSQKMYSWIQNEEDKKQAITAIYLYVYLTRGEGEE